MSKAYARWILPAALALLILCCPALCSSGDGVASASSSLVTINSTTFPDANFRSIVLASYSDGAGHVNTGVKRIIVRGKDIADLTGIRYFTSLTELDCGDNQLTSLNLSGNTALLYLKCQNNQLTSLNVSNNRALELLYCFENRLTSLNTANCAALYTLRCNTNQLTSLNVSGNTSLLSLHCFDNSLTALDISKNTSLKNLDCSLNSLSSLDVSHNASLASLLCGSNALTSLHVTANPALEELYCGGNPLGSLDVSHNAQLALLSCDDNGLTALDVSANPALESLNCVDNLLSSLNVTGNAALSTLECNMNRLASLDLTHNPLLAWLNCGDNKLTSLNVSANPALESLDCSFNRLTELNVTANTALIGLDCWGNLLTALDVSRNTELRALRCIDNKLLSLDVSHNIALTSLACDNNRLSSLDLSNNLYLSDVSLSNQYAGPLEATQSGGAYRIGLTELPYGDRIDINRVTVVNGGVLDKSTGIVSYGSYPETTAENYEVMTYFYDTGCPAEGVPSMPVVVTVPIRDFTAPLTDGSAFNIAAYRGRVVIVIVWTTTCPYSKLEIPDLQKLAEAYPDTLTVLGLNSGESKAAIQAFADENHLTYLQAVDAGKAIRDRLFPTEEIPYTIVIDRNGVVTKAYTGYMGELMYAHLESWYLDALANPFTPANSGDANNDGGVDIMDLVVIVDYIVNGNAPASMTGADANGDGTVDIMDLVFIINLIVNPPVSSGMRVDAAAGNTVSVEVPFYDSSPITALELTYTLSPGLTFVSAECAGMTGAGGDTGAMFANVNGGATAGMVTLTVRVQNGIMENQSVNVTAVTGASTAGTRAVGSPQTYGINVNASALSILTQPVDTTVSLGNTATFTVEATGPEPLTYQWYVNTNTGVGWLAIAGATEAAYTTGAAVIGDDGFRYFCRVTAGESYLDSAIAAFTVVAYPQTGDGSHPAWMIALALLAVAGISVLLPQRHRYAGLRKEQKLRH